MPPPGSSAIAGRTCELAVSWAIVGQRPAGEYGHLYQALIALRRRLRQFHYLHNEWLNAYEKVYDTDSPF
jgi:hypothetical protein